jgi:16S rRNA (guanine1207-N2)-methyltransferase
MVTKRKEWYKQKLISIFGGVSIREVEGYYVFMAEKKSSTYAGARASSK